MDKYGSDSKENSEVGEIEYNIYECIYTAFSKMEGKGACHFHPPAYAHLPQPLGGKTPCHGRSTIPQQRTPGGKTGIASGSQLPIRVLRTK